MNEVDTTSSSRIFVKIMMQEVPEGMGLPVLGCSRWITRKTPASLSITLQVSDLVRLLRRASQGEPSIQRLFITDLMCCSLEHASPDYGMVQRRAMLEAESSSSDSSSDANSSSEDSLSDSDSESDASDDFRDRRSYRRSSTPPRQYRRDLPRLGRGDSRTPSPPPRHRPDSPRRRRDDRRSASPPRSRRDDDRQPDGRSGYGRNRRESPPPAGRHRRHSDSVSRMPPHSRSRSPPRRESARDWDRFRDYDRRRDGSRDRYRDCRR